jgi:pullulanase
MEGLRSKSLDRNSFDSGDWFNRLDWRFLDNFFGTGLPAKADNANNYALFKPLLANAGFKPSAREIQWTRDAFFDLLRIRASTKLLRLDTAAEIEKRLRFLNTGSKQEATVLAAVLDGADLADAGFLRLAYFINVDTKAHMISDAGEHNQNYVLHPVHFAATAADLRVREARYDAEQGAFSIPARTAVVFVVPAAARANAVTK